MRVAVIGAGITGLVSCKYCKEAGFDVVVYEQSKDIGGTWVYTEETKAHSSMYRNLITNSPVEVMGFKDFEFPSGDKSYVSWKEVLTFIKEYEKCFALKDSIKFEHVVTKVDPLEDDKWEVTVRDMYKSEAIIEVFDAIFVCNGHFSTPNMPNIKGIESFSGLVLHSHEYRDPEKFNGMNVLIVGSGPSGIDITFDLSKVAKHVGISHHSTLLAPDLFPTNVVQLPDIDRISIDGNVYFSNDMVGFYDAIMFCTGYKYNLSFLTDTCGIRTINNHVTSLYKHVLNIERPTMFFIGLTNVTIFTHLIELQVQFSLKVLLNQINLPSRKEMYEELQRDTKDRHSKSYKGRKMHQLWPEYMRSYFDNLVQLANLTPIRPVLLDIYDECRALSYTDMKNYRKYRYQIIDDLTYVKEEVDV